MINSSSPSLPVNAQVTPFTPGSDSSTFFAELYSASWSGVVSVAVPSGTVTHIRAFSDPKIDQAYGGGFDGRWLVWAELLSSTDTNDWQIWAWDTTTNQSSVIATAPRTNGATVLGPIVEPVVSNGMAAWVQANQAGIGETHLYSLALHHDEIVATHVTTPVIFWGSNLIWQAVDVPQQSGHLVMVDVASRAAVTVPEPLASVHHLSFLATSDNVVAWTDGPSIWAYRSGQVTASLVYHLNGDHADFIAIAGQLITWDTSSTGPAALDLRSSSVVSLTPAAGGRFAVGNSLLIYWPSGQSKSASSAIVISDVDVSKLPALPGCS